MSEFILVLPFLLLILMLLFYFGRGMLRVQHTQVMATYEAWRLSAPVRDQQDNEPVLPQPEADSHAAMNAAFFGGNAQEMDFNVSGWFWPDANNALEAAASSYDPDAGELVGLHTRGDGGVRVAATVRHQESRPLWERFNRTLSARRVLFGTDWAFVHGWQVNRQPPSPDDHVWSYDPHRRAAPSVMTAVRDRYFTALDQRLEVLTTGTPPNPLASGIRGLYLGEPGYRGPKVTAN
jgi:hypothetical protein